MDHSVIARKNRLLASLSTATYERLAPHLKYLPMAKGTVLYDSAFRPNYLYFPVTSVVSKIQVMECGDMAEIAIIGSDGMVGTSLFMGTSVSGRRAQVQQAGFGYRIRAEVVIEEFFLGGEFQQLMLRFIMTLITQMAQTAVCNRHHSLQQQFCRLLLTNLDHIQSNELLMTQEVIANLLGVRREGITEAARRLQGTGVIQYRRGCITVTNRAELEKLACECYTAIKEAYDRLLAPGNRGGNRAPPRH
jgi:CRP-like cAMP-binding protein